jgi:hypothetical protein
VASDGFVSLAGVVISKALREAEAEPAVHSTAFDIYGQGTP